LVSMPADMGDLAAEEAGHVVIRETTCKTILNRSSISDYSLNCYTGCTHGCVYCYARFMQRFHPHPEPWGEFVDVKVNAVEVLERQLRMVLLAKELLDGGARPEEVGRRLNISRDFVLRRVVQQARRLSWDRLEFFHNELLKADLAIKRGRLDEELALDLLLSRFSRPAGVRHP